MNPPNTAVATVTQTRAPVPIGDRGIRLTSMDDLWRFAQYVGASGLAPKGITTPEAVFVAVQMGLEVGLTPMAALQNIAVINGRPTIWGDAQLAVCRATGEMDEFNEWYEEAGKKLPRNPSAYTDLTAAVTRVKRAGYEAKETSFSVADAKAAGLWGKQGPWTQYPARMLRFRSRSFALRDEFGDALRGMRATEEAMDEPINVTPEAPKGQRRTRPIVEAAVTEAIPVTQNQPASEPEPAPTPDPTASTLDERRATFRLWLASVGSSEMQFLLAASNHEDWPIVAGSTVDEFDEVTLAWLGSKRRTIAAALKEGAK